MARFPVSIAITGAIAGALLAAAPAAADPAFDELERALPAGWSLLATGSELVLRHDQPCYLTGVHRDSAPPHEGNAAVAAGGGPLVTIELRYRLEPRWTAPQLTAARAANDRIDGELHTLATRYRIDAIRHTKAGRPLPANADEQHRIEAYEAARTRLAARQVKLPHCTLGDSAVFDGEATYAQLRLEVDPPEVMTQAHHVVELMQQRCH